MVIKSSHCKFLLRENVMLKLRADICMIFILQLYQVFLIANILFDF